MRLILNFRRLSRDSRDFQSLKFIGRNCGRAPVPRRPNGCDVDFRPLSDTVCTPMTIIRDGKKKSTRAVDCEWDRRRTAHCFLVSTPVFNHRHPDAPPDPIRRRFCVNEPAITSAATAENLVRKRVVVSSFARHGNFHVFFFFLVLFTVFVVRFHTSRGGGGLFLAEKKIWNSFFPLLA